MSLWKEINEIASSKKDLRKFGVTLGLVFGLLGVFLLWRGRDSWVYFAGGAGFFLVFGLVLPMALKPLQKVWMALALLMGWVMSRIILMALFFLVVTPIGLAMRLMGKDLLELKPGVIKMSYWAPHRTRPKEDYENQF